MHLPTFIWCHVLPGVLATCSVEIFDHYTVESPHPQISLTVSGSPGKMSDFTAPDEGRTTAASKPGSTQLNAWQFYLFPLVFYPPHWFCVQLSTEHWAWDLPFPKTRQMSWLIQPRSTELTCEGKVDQWGIGDERELIL